MVLRWSRTTRHHDAVPGRLGSRWSRGQPRRAPRLMPHAHLRTLRTRSQKPTMPADDAQADAHERPGRGVAGRVVDQESEDEARDDGTGEHPAEACEVATPKRRVRVSIGHPLRSLSQVCSSRCTTTSAHAPRGTGEARKLSQRDGAANGAGRAHTSASDRVTRPAVVMSVAAVSVSAAELSGVLVKTSTSASRARQTGSAATASGQVRPRRARPGAGRWTTGQDERERDREAGRDADRRSTSPGRCRG